MQNVAKNEWKLTKVARIGRSRSLYGQKRMEGGVGQSREPKLSVCCLHNSAHPFLAKKRPGAPVFGFFSPKMWGPLRPKHLQEIQKPKYLVEKKKKKKKKLVR